MEYGCSDNESNKDCVERAKLRAQRERDMTEAIDDGALGLGTDCMEVMAIDVMATGITNAVTAGAINPTAEAMDTTAVGTDATAITNAVTGGQRIRRRQRWIRRPRIRMQLLLLSQTQ